MKKRMMIIIGISFYLLIIGLIFELNKSNSIKASRQLAKASFKYGYVCGRAGITEDECSIKLKNILYKNNKSKLLKINILKNDFSLYNMIKG